MGGPASAKTGPTRPTSHTKLEYRNYVKREKRKRTERKRKQIYLYTRETCKEEQRRARDSKNRRSSELD
jgi:hypothetical protein